MKAFKKLLVASIIGCASISAAQAAYSTVGGATVTNGDTVYTYKTEVTTTNGTYSEYLSTNYYLDGGAVARGDNLLASTSFEKGNSLASELEFINDVLGSSLEEGSFIKYDNSTSLGFAVEELDNDVYGLVISDDYEYVEGGYFLLKFGGSDSHYLMENTGSSSDFTWLAAMQPKNTSIDRLSHVTICSTEECMEEGNEGGEVPLPAAVWLFGSALFGLVGVGRKKKSTAA